MKLSRVLSVALRGVDGVLVEIEAHIGQGLPGVHLVGMTDTALQESKDRVRAAVTNSSFRFPEGRVTLALSPATLPKSGSHYDLPLALACLAADGQVDTAKLSSTVFIGELALDGRLRPVRGVLPAMLAAQAAGVAWAVVPIGNVAEASLVTGVEVGGAQDLGQVHSWLAGQRALDTVGPTEPTEPQDIPDMNEVAGQEQARWAMEVAAAGAHHLFFTGPPGIGKTMLAGRLPGILPPLTEAESLEVTAIHSVAGTLTSKRPLIEHPPFVAPHHTTSMVAMVGGGNGIAKPGAISRAHRGVLFLDECAEIGAKTLDTLRTPLEEGKIRIARRDGVATFPARFQLIMAANPCPCAPARDVDCLCSPTVRRRYLGRLSGPLMDRVDIRVRMDPPDGLALAADTAESSAAVRARVIDARGAAAARWAERGWSTNAEVPGPALRRDFRLPAQVVRPIELFLRDGRVTARGADRALRLAWTLADLGGQSAPSESDVAQALMFRDRGYE